MVPLLIIIAALSFLGAGAAFAMVEETASVFHEILGAIFFLITTVCVAAVGIIRAINKGSSCPKSQP
jgi:hypothetical protein